MTTREGINFNKLLYDVTIGHSNYFDHNKRSDFVLYLVILED